MHHRKIRLNSLRRTVVCCAVLLLSSAVVAVGEETDRSLTQPEEVRLLDVRQLTFGGENAEAYWSPDGSSLIYQATVPPHDCDQIFTVDISADGFSEPRLVSTGDGRTTCAYYSYPQGDRIYYSSTHLGDKSCPAVPDRSLGYVWPLYGSFDIFSAAPDGSDVVRLTTEPGYDAEATVCPVDGSILFTSTRDGDLELYRMDADGSNVKRLTHAPGYDGGGFFSQDCSKIVWRASRPATDDALADFRRLLDQDLVRPSKLEIWVADADGSNARQVTYLDAASFAPYFFPSGERIIFSTNHGDPRGREFDIWAIDIDGTDLERITFTPEFDGFPIFSPDGKWLSFASNRHHEKPGETNVFVARWNDKPETVPGAAKRKSPVDRYLADVAWLADDEREGRGVGTEGLREAAEWLEQQFAAIGLEPAGDDGTYRNEFPVTVDVGIGSNTGLEIAGNSVPEDSFRPASFSADGTVEAMTVAAGYGIRAEAIEIDDYEGVDAQGKIVVVRRFTPEGGPFDDSETEQRYSDLRFKAFTAREQGAAALIVVDQPQVEAGEDLPEEASLPGFRLDMGIDAGIPVIYATREAAAHLLDGSPRSVRLTVELEREVDQAWNVVGRLPGSTPDGGGEPRLVVIGAHYDHLGFGGRGSLDPESSAPHNGADDNASGTAALLEVARQLAGRSGTLDADVVFAAFSAEESGLLGSSSFTRNPPAGIEIDRVAAMLNMDMVGRLRNNTLSVLGAESATEWKTIVTEACSTARLECEQGGDGYGASDQTPFYAAGIPVLHAFSGIHDEYHKPSDDVETINAAGGAQVAQLIADIAAQVANHEGPLTYHRTEGPPPRGDTRSAGASLGTIPDYAGPEEGESNGVLLAGVRPGSAAEKAGMQRGDLLVELSGHAIGDIYDMVFVLRKSKAGEATTAVVVRDGERVELDVVFEASRGIR